MNSDFDTIPYSPQYDDLCLSFSCGNAILDGFIHNLENQNPDICKTYLWIGEKHELIGYYSLTTGQVDQIDEYGARLKLGGSIHINDFAIDSQYRGKYIYGNTKYSDHLLKDCINRILFIRDDHVGFSFITLKSTKEGYSLYKRHEFEEVEEDMDFSSNKDEIFSISMFFALGLEDIQNYIF